jgi:hypothetical protein
VNHYHLLQWDRHLPVKHRRRRRLGRLPNILEALNHRRYFLVGDLSVDYFLIRRHLIRDLRRLQNLLNLLLVEYHCFLHQDHRQQM